MTEDLREQRTVIGAAALSSMLAPLNSTMIVVALPALLNEFHRSLAWGTWIITSYLVAMATVQPLAGSLGDRLGRRRLMSLGLIGFLLASILAALSWRIEVLLVARTAQAICGAVAIPNGIALVRQQLPPERQGRASGTISSVVAVAAGVGPTFGGIVTGLGGWRWIFAANLLLIAPALFLVSRTPRETLPSEKRPFDLMGAALLTSSLVSLVLSLSLLRVPAVPRIALPVLGLVALALGALLVHHVRRSRHPLVDPELFRARGYTTAVSGVLLTNLAMYTVLLSLPVFLVQNAGWGAGATGLLLSGLSLQMVLFSPIGGRLADSYGARLPAVIGSGLVIAGLLPLLMIGTGWNWLAYLGTVTLIGAGSGLVAPPIQASAVLAVTPAKAGQAAGFFSTMRYFGSIAGATMMGALLTGKPPSPGHFQMLYAALVIAAVLAVVVCRRLPGQDTQLQLAPRAGEAAPN